MVVSLLVMISEQRRERKWIEKISPRMAVRWGVIPIYKADDGAVAVLTRDENDLEILQNLEFMLNSPVAPVACGEADFKKALQECYGLGAEAIDDLPEESSISDSDISLENSDAAIARFVTSLIQQAHRDRATDIHLEPFENDLLIRFRIDGILRSVSAPPSLYRFRSLLASRIKLTAQMNIAEKRLPQDGRILFNAREEELDIRVSTIPTIYGESIDLRILPRTRLVAGPEELGVRPDCLSIVSRLIHRPNGIILVTGPTGHGKTTTLYAFLSQINSPDKKIITIEDPVELRLKGINQIQAHSKIGLTFSNGLRAILRQDPDVIMVGEIRDRETAEIAVRASLTGHLVFSTLHTNDAIGAVTRLIDMGIEPYLVASSLSAVIGQRLVRVLCSQCRGKEKSCETCRGTGYFGRTGLFEFFVLNEALRNLILSGASPAIIREKARALGMQTLFEEGKIKVAEGRTSMEEIIRVTEEL